MNFDKILSFFCEYSLYSLLISLIVGILFLVLEKPLKKCPKTLRSYSPMLLCIVLVIVFDYYFCKTSFSLKQSFAVGVFSGSLSYAVTSFFRKKEKGEKPSFSVLELSLSEILNDFTDQEKSTVIAKEIHEAVLNETSISRVKIDEILNNHLKDELEPSALTLAKTLVTVAVSSLNLPNKVTND